MTKMPEYSGFLNLNKPAGMTSHDCVGRIRRLLGMKRVGHGGTLDPAAEGVLPIALGKATRLLQYLQEDKAYRAIVRLGVTTTTDDTDGPVIAAQPMPQLTLELVREALEQFEGKIQQVPPAYSAIQVQGQRLYNLARRGEKVVVPSREVEVRSIELLGWQPGDFPEVQLAVSCGAGTYIRAIARDLGVALGGGGTLAYLQRTAACGFTLPDSLTFDQIETQLHQNTFQPISPAAALTHLASVTLTPENARRWCQGQQISDFTFAPAPTSHHSSSIVQVTREDGLFLGIGNIAELPIQLQAKTVFAQPENL